MKRSICLMLSIMMVLSVLISEGMEENDPLSGKQNCFPFLIMPALQSPHNRKFYNVVL